MVFDSHQNFAFGHVSVAPVPPDSGTSLVLITGDALKFPATPFNATVYPINTRPNPTNAEIVRVTNITGDVLTIVRTQEGSGSRTILPTDEFSATITKKTLTDIEDSIAGFILPNAAFTGSLVFGTSASRVVPGATSLAFRNNANNADNLLISDAGLVTVRNGLNVAAGGAIVAAGDLAVSNGNLIFGAGTTSIIPGATALRIRNTANTVTHWNMTDNGQITIFPETAPTGFPGTAIGVQFGTTSNTYTTPQNTGSVLVRVDGNFKNTTDSTGYWRALSTEVHWTDAVFGASTFAAVYANVYHDTATDVQDIIGVIGRVFFTAPGPGGAVPVSSVGAWGVRGDLNFITGTTLATVVTSAAGVIGHQGSWITPCTITTYSAIEARAHTLNAGGAVVTDGYGVLVGMPQLATQNNIGVMIGNRFAWNGTVGLMTGSNGALFKGHGVGTGVPADATSGISTIGICAGDNGGTNSVLCALYYYKGTTAVNYIGFDTDATTVIAGHTKLVTDFTLKAGKLVFDTNGQIYATNKITSGTLSTLPTAATSGGLPTAILFTAAAHTGLTPGNFAEVNWNAARTVTFDGTGSPTVATMYTFQFQKPTYTAITAAFTVTIAATMRITGAPTASASAGFAPTFTAAYALYIDAGNIGFGGAANFVLDATTGTKIGTATTQKLGFWNATPVVQPTGTTATITNNVTSGGTTNTIANFTDLSVYANDAATIRNDIFQLAATQKIVVDALRLIGLMT